MPSFHHAVFVADGKIITVGSHTFDVEDQDEAKVEWDNLIEMGDREIVIFDLLDSEYWDMDPAHLVPYLNDTPSDWFCSQPFHTIILDGNDYAAMLDAYSKLTPFLTGPWEIIQNEIVSNGIKITICCLLDVLVNKYYTKKKLTYVLLINSALIMLHAWCL